MGRIRTCSSRCHNAKKPRCRCWCGGHYHGSQGAGNREALVQAVTDADQALLLQQHGFKEGETKYVQQLQLEKPKPMISSLLADEEIGDLLDLEKEYTYPCSDGSRTTTIDCHKVAKAQDAKTLKAVGEWLESRLGQDISNFTQGFITLGDIEALKRGEMP